MLYKNLPYACKERINLFCLKKYTDYPALQEFNKICDYEPCEYSNNNLISAENRYYKKMKKNEIEINKFIKKNLLKKKSINENIMKDCFHLLESSFAKMMKSQDYYYCRDCKEYKLRLVQFRNDYTGLHNWERDSFCDMCLLCNSILHNWEYIIEETINNLLYNFKDEVENILIDNYDILECDLCKKYNKSKNVFLIKNETICKGCFYSK